MTRYALTDIISHTTGKLYAERGDELDVYCFDHAPVMCCRDVRGNMFPCRVELLGEVRPEEMQPVAKTKPLPIKTARTETLIEKLQREYLNSKK